MYRICASRSVQQPFKRLINNTMNRCKVQFRASNKWLNEWINKKKNFNFENTSNAMRKQNVVYVHSFYLLTDLVH